MRAAGARLVEAIMDNPYTRGWQGTVSRRVVSPVERLAL
jgi:hypothetical protein